MSSEMVFELVKTTICQYGELTAVEAHTIIDGGISSSSGTSMMHKWNMFAFFCMTAVLGLSVKKIDLRIRPYAGFWYGCFVSGFPWQWTQSEGKREQYKLTLLWGYMK